MITITLTPDLEQIIAECAEKQGTTPELVALDTLRQHWLPAQDANRQGAATLADLLGDSIGCLDSGDLVPGGARMSENIREKFSQGMVEKRGRGRL